MAWGKIKSVVYYEISTTSTIALDYPISVSVKGLCTTTRDSKVLMHITKPEDVLYY
jgi:hypothetical protein